MGLIIFAAIFNVSIAFGAQSVLAPEEGDIQESASVSTPRREKLVIDGVGENGYVTLTSTVRLSLELKGAVKIDPQNTSIVLFKKTGSKDITAWFDYDSKKAKYTLQQANLKALLKEVRASGTASMAISLSPTHFEHTYNFNKGLTFAAASMQIEVSNADGSPARDLVGTDFEIIFNWSEPNEKKWKQTLNKDGKIILGGLPHGNYKVTQVMKVPGIALSAFCGTPDPEGSVTVQIFKPLNKTSGQSVAAKCIASPSQEQRP